MSTPLFLSPISLIVQYFTNLGVIAKDAQIYTYVAGTLDTVVTTYTDNAGLVANANPMTASSTGRPAGQSGQAVAFWAPSGTSIKLVVNDAAGNQLVYLDQIPLINDPAAIGGLAGNLLNPAPGFGADLVANAVKSYALIANLRGANVPALASGQTLIVELEGGSALNDGLGGAFYWSASSTASDNGTTVINPTTNPGNGRFLRLLPYILPIYTLVKPTDQSVISTTVLANDSALVSPTLTAGATYLLQLRLQLEGVGDTGQGYVIQPTFSGSLTGNCIGGGVASANGTPGAIEASISVPTSVAAISETGDFLNADVIFKVATAGTIQMQFTQASSEAHATVMKANSVMIISRLA